MNQSRRKGVDTRQAAVQREVGYVAPVDVDATSSPRSQLSLVSAMNGRGLIPSQPQLCSPQRIGSGIAPTQSKTPISLTSQGLNPAEQIEQDRMQLLRMQEQHPHKHQQAFLAAAQSRAAFLSPLSINFTSRPMATLSAVRAELEKEHVKLRSQETLQSVSLCSNQEQSAPFGFLREGTFASQIKTVVNPVTETQQRRMLPFRLPDPLFEDEEYQDAGSEHTRDASSAPKEKFPFKLYRMLEEAAKNGDDGIVSFFPDGKAFAVHKPRDFVAIMPKYFSTNRMSSFQRQLNLYGFRRIMEGHERGAYFHECFRRGRKDLCKKILRKIPVSRSLTAPDSTEARFSTEDLGNSITALSRSTLNQAILSQLSQQHQLQRLITPISQTPQSLFSFGRPAIPGPGTSVATTDVRRLASEIVAIERQRSDFFHQLFRAQQHQANGNNRGI